MQLNSSGGVKQTKKEADIKSPILTGLTGDERVLMKRALLASAPVLERLEQLIEKELQKLEENSTDFDNPSWAYRQAYVLGFRKGLTNFKKYAIISK